jgi:hypothetical protein
MHFPPQGQASLGTNDVSDARSNDEDYEDAQEQVCDDGKELMNEGWMDGREDGRKKNRRQTQNSCILCCVVTCGRCTGGGRGRG